MEKTNLNQLKKMKLKNQQVKPKPKDPRGRPKTRDILNLSQSIPAESPEALAKLILSTPPEKVR